MRRVLGKIAGFLSNRNMVGVDKAGNKYFTRTEEVDGIMKEKRWVVFKGEDDPTSIPVEWICWLNGQRKKAPTPEEMMELEARRERVRQNVALLKKEEEERRAKEGSTGKRVSTGKVAGPELKSFIRQFPATSEGSEVEEASDAMGDLRNSQENIAQKEKVEPERQDEELDELSLSVQKIGSVGLTIHEELLSQERIIDELGAEMDSTTNRLDFVQKKVAMVMKKASAKGQIMMILGLLALFIFLFILVFFT